MTTPATTTPATVHVYEALVELKRRRDAAKVSTTSSTPTATPTGDVVVITDPVAYVEAALRRLVSELAGTTTGGRNAAAHECARSVGRMVGAGLPLDPTPAVEALLDACRTNGLVGDDGEASAMASIRSGYSWGHEHPMAWTQGQSAPAATPFDVPGVTTTAPATATPSRTVQLTPASSIKVRPIHWLWDERVALGTLVLLGGREGIGKSTIAYTLAADLTRGRLKGRHHGVARAVIVAATEDSWEHTIVPRLMAADADLDLIYRVDVVTSEGVDTTVSLPRDIPSLVDSVRSVSAALILLDPLMSRLDASLDTHKDAEVRLALEPLVKVADTTGAAVLGLIHVNKSSSSDPLTMLMGSRAFAAVARGVLFVMVDPDDEQRRLLGQPKNNLGRTDLPTIAFAIESAVVADTDEGQVFTGRIIWLGDSDRTIADALAATAGTQEERGATSEAAEWLRDYLTISGGEAPSKDIKAAGRAAGHSDRALQRARLSLRAEVTYFGYPKTSAWCLPVGIADQSRQNPGET